MGVEGFELTNYQSEIPEYFKIGREIETYFNKEELYIEFSCKTNDKYWF